MRIRFVTTVISPFNNVRDGFNQRLFEFLLPPAGLVKIVRYEGQNPGDIIDLKINFPLIGNHWTVIIKESWQSHREYGFVDRGLRVPFGILYWKHAHRVVARDNKSCFIIDDIEFETSTKIVDLLLYLPLWIMFFPRKFQYKKYFEQPHNPS
jgi:ligand-binding SRPBCC domain-containing protein